MSLSCMAKAQEIPEEDKHSATASPRIRELYEMLSGPPASEAQPSAPQEERRKAEETPDAVLIELKRLNAQVQAISRQLGTGPLGEEPALLAALRETTARIDRLDRSVGDLIAVLRLVAPGDARRDQQR